MRRQSDVSTDGDVVHQHDRTGPEDSHGCKLGRSRIRVVGFWLRLDVLPINHANDIPLLPRPANLPILSNATGGSVGELVRDRLDTDLRMVNHLL